MWTPACPRRIKISFCIQHNGADFKTNPLTCYTESVVANFFSSEKMSFSSNIFHTLEWQKCKDRQLSQLERTQTTGSACAACAINPQTGYHQAKILLCCWGKWHFPLWMFLMERVSLNLLSLKRIFQSNFNGITLCYKRAEERRI